ncbi:hypothetical protein [Gloeobacter violaceus]|uniref:Gll1333 protein n=1 Tax=Gloeobacter violaceus (strain ATCC 29082 / PCC 7421) TaxID=251221 RepID=Q7NKZ3_GLOVI|nr:hypothetical protein [Gloeobacter violaceus]BAC89274.1 gll1333 [Gloeobacter violaceus PCC 7421]
MAVVSREEAQKLELLKDLSVQEVQTFAQILKEQVHRSLENGSGEIDALLGRRYSLQDRAQLELESLARAFAHRREILTATISAPEVAKLLGTSRQTPHDRVKARTLLAVMDNGILRFPLWQFDPQGLDGVLAGLSAVLKALQVADFAKASWFVRPNPVLDGLSPADALKKGMLDRVLEEAAAVGRGQN